MFLNVCKQIFHISRVRISQGVRCVIMRSPKHIIFIWLIIFIWALGYNSMKIFPSFQVTYCLPTRNIKQTKKKIILTWFTTFDSGVTTYATSFSHVRLCTGCLDVKFVSFLKSRLIFDIPLFLNVCKQIFHISRVRISQGVRCVIMRSPKHIIFIWLIIFIWALGYNSMKFWDFPDLSKF